MIPKRHLQVAVAASLVALGIVGCGTEGPDDVVTDDDPLGETAQAGTPRKCVNIIQKHDGAALGYSYSSDSVFTDPLGRPPSAQFAWCLTDFNKDGLTFRLFPYDFQSTNTKELQGSETASDDYKVTVRPAAPIPQQVWEIRRELSLAPLFPNVSGTFRINLLTTEKYLDAYTSSTNRRAVTREFQYDNTQRWYIKDAGCTCDPI